MTPLPPAYCPPPSAHATIAWPALPGPQAAQMLALLQQFDRSQWWSPRDLQAQQLRQAGALLDHAYRHLPFYRNRLAQAGFLPGKPLTPEVWARVPVMDRAALQAAGPALYSPALPESHGKVYEISSSGSTGRPVTARSSRVAQLMWDALTIRDHLWHRRDFSGRLAAIRSFPSGTADYPRGAESPLWGRSLQGIFATGPSSVLTIATRTNEQAEWLQRVQPEYLLTYPSALRELLLYCRDQGITLPRLREVRTLSEQLPPETRRLCREVWGVKLVDIYSTQENGYLAFQCPEHDHYHCQSEVNWVEVLNPAGEACRPGEVGEVVVTSLTNFAMPMIRYAVGDMAEVGPPCPCGRGLPVLSEILGRVRNMAVFPDGRKARLPIGDIWLVEIPEIQQIQIIQRSLEAMEVKLVTSRPLTSGEERRVRDWLAHRSGNLFAITVTYHEEIPRGPSGKFEDFRCEVA
jgi:phenylacetate-coenzyme A ligase PaaK-like adenylate-forming protein